MRITIPAILATIGLSVSAQDAEMLRHFDYDRNAFWTSSRPEWTSAATWKCTIFHTPAHEEGGFQHTW